ncbi:MAG: SMI1/KNR4 family protein [Acidobacteriia bacterium]|nr:SMI1/KNR4 family protein [Terriglobia bacterium]
MAREIRAVLDELKILVDAMNAADPEAWIRGKKMVLHLGAAEQAIKKFFASDVGLGFPPSYAEFLAASDGVEWMWRGLHFMPADPRRQKFVNDRRTIMLDRFAARFCTFQGDPTEENIAQWRSDGSVYLPMTTVVAASPVGDLLLYDHYSVDAAGEMQIGLQGRTDLDVKQWHPNITAWLQACLSELRAQPRHEVEQSTQRVARSTARKAKKPIRRS